MEASDFLNRQEKKRSVKLISTSYLKDPEKLPGQSSENMGELGFLKKMEELKASKVSSLGGGFSNYRKIHSVKSNANNFDFY
jgi:hypothetical protein